MQIPCKALQAASQGGIRSEAFDASLKWETAYACIHVLHVKW